MSRDAMSFESSLPTVSGPGAARVTQVDRSEDRLLSWRDVQAMTGLSRTTAWRRQKAGDFPLPVQLTPGRVGWWMSDLAAWKARRAPRGCADVPRYLPSRPEQLGASPSPMAPPQQARPMTKSRSSRESADRLTDVVQLALEF